MIKNSVKRTDLTANFFAGNTGRLQPYAEDLNRPVEFLMLAEVVIHLSSA